MAARAIWKGRLLLGDHEVPVKMYSAVQDRKVHFRLLHAKDLSPIEQRIVRKTDGKEVPKDQQRKAYPVGPDTAVILQPEELDRTEPESSRDITLCRFVPSSLISDQWYDRPYYLGPDGDEPGYFALAQALERKDVAGIARWAMRKKRYVGALRLDDGYLTMITLRRADQVVSVTGIEIPPARKPDAKELKLAEQLVAAIAADFEPESWKDEYRERVLKLIEAKAGGATIAVRQRKAPRPSGGLAEQLRQSVSAAREKKVA